jgi:flagellar basal-body rod protein FlgB
MMDRLFKDAQVPLLEKMLRFTQARQGVLAEDVVNLSTPNYRPKDLSLDKFQQLLRKEDPAGEGDTDEATEAALDPKEADNNILFHDRNNRSVEQLMADQASNALLHNMMVELMRQKFNQIQEALKERVG